MRTAFIALQIFGQLGNVGGEPLCHPQQRSERKDGQRCARLDIAHILEHLAAHLRLVGYGRVQPIQQQHVDRAGLRIGGDVGVSVGRQRGSAGGSRRGRRGPVLVEGGNGLFAPILEDMKLLPFQPMNGLVSIGNHHVHQYQFRVGA